MTDGRGGSGGGAAGGRGSSIRRSTGGTGTLAVDAGVKVTYGGVIASALDVAAGLVCVGSTLTRHDTINEDELRQRLARMGTIDLRVDYLRPGRGNRFTCTSSLLRAGNKVAVARVELHNEEQVYIASATATYMVG